MAIETYIRDIPDFPKPGIIFKDITPLLASPAGLAEAVDQLAAAFADSEATKILGAEARGFIFGTAVAYTMGVGFVPVRKPGKLPYKSVEVSYELEYGTDTLCMHEDAILPGEKVLIIDDLLATGGTAKAMVQMIRERGARVMGAGFVIELDFLKGREALGDVPVHSLLHVAGE